jgi:uncharacterized membrane protein
MSEDRTSEDKTSENQGSSEQDDGIAAAAAVTDGAYTLFAADFTGADTAWEAYEALKEVEDGRTLEIESVIVVKRDADGTLEVLKATDRSTRRGLRWGLVGGVVLGVIFPPSILGSAALLGAAGAGVGKAREIRNRKDLAEELQDAIAPGHSGIIALVSDPGAVEIRKALAKADAIVEKALDKAEADEIKAAAAAADS